MAPLAFTVLTTELTGSYRLGGVMMTVFVLAELAGAVPAGRLLDRIGPARGLMLLLTCAALALGGLATAAAAGAPAGALLVLVAVPGLIAGGLSGGFRTLLAGTVDDGLLTRAIAVDAMIIDAVLILGPVLVALLTVADPLVPLAVMALAYLLSAALVPRGLAPPRPDTGSGGRPGVPLRAASCWLACQFAIGHLLATIEVAPLPLVQRLGADAAAAPLVIVAVSGASILGGAFYAWRGARLRATPRWQATVLLCGFVAGGMVVGLDLGWPGLLLGVVLIGVCTAPLLTVASVQLQRLLPERRRAEGFSLSFAVQSTGFGLGSLSVGVLPLELAPALGVFSALAGCVLLWTSAPLSPVDTGE
ncbi:MFS transporter [Amycolatopsis antarctica]|uniref:MFS transporter n=2 Tax=Amycolatopsis antarctica TaxID=1854586 RepID=A0A263D005_9PSEU|nr:MFS transporter [Amycolatopsis antarctica]OZM71549.1 MFS transporter [Amycolatopsis antarctica]